ncbi:MAG: hypothetical protein AVDCRST_MAG08-1964 [uncultured Acetobacteraceae bacterium]|uniref:Uncharacterized protein n=1 Tax=uncultured Acetobacteraceae bacterium TaxID=169975 RepID=A0A6J4IBT0_9PROT|nr:MAG: hypothetical protein AVDCRST_MAG08-1964 [uncultured Acetobacteraceae bacterium]
MPSWSCALPAAALAKPNAHCSSSGSERPAAFHSAQDHAGARADHRQARSLRRNRPRQGRRERHDGAQRTVAGQFE